MKTLVLKLTSALFVLFTVQIYAQNIENIDIERIYDQNIIIPSLCSPEDIIILINSSIENLKFESNILPDNDFKVIHIEESNQYFICHEKERFKLTVSGPNLQSEDIPIFNLNESYAFRLTANIHKGTVKINTNPRNSTILIPALGNLALSSEEKITNHSGKYRVNIIKPNYNSIDTVIVIPRDSTIIETYNFELEPVFAKIKINITTEDNAEFEKPPILWIDDKRISMDAMLKPNMAKRFHDEVVFFNLYEDNVIPMREGNYELRIEADNYIPYETFIHAERGKVNELDIMLELIFGHITFIDASLNSDGAEVYINDQPIGQVPIFKAKARVGSNIIRFKKPGFMTDTNEYRVIVTENANTDFYVSMSTSRKVVIESDPHNAEVLLNGTRIGFTPHTTSVPAGEHKITVKRAGYASEVINLNIENVYREEDLLRVELQPNNPLIVKSEEPGSNIYFEGLEKLKNTEIIKNTKTPADVMLPYGTYRFVTTDDHDRVTYRGLYKHHEKRKRTKLPNYSRTSFSLLTADYIDVMNLEASFGRIHIFSGSGLSTALLNVHYYVFNIDNNEYETIIPHVFFLNWDWRLGGSIIRQFDICALGRVKWTPGLKMAEINLLNYHDASMLTYFYGLEVSTRITFLNLNCKIGMQNFDGSLNIWNSEINDYMQDPVTILMQNMMISFGVTFNGRVGKSNNMLRLWRKPLVNQIIDKF
jgi:hypothetical protein